SKRIAALHRLPIRSVLAARCALRCAPMAARSLRHLIRDATLGPVIRCAGLRPVRQSTLSGADCCRSPAGRLGSSASTRRGDRSRRHGGGVWASRAFTCA
ncbi:hypothetical protein D8B29_20535, partial [Verminephrobacter eiseniae]|nr:hypothetical protein [Verminephrobacter eiseniae]